MLGITVSLGTAMRAPVTPGVMNSMRSADHAVAVNRERPRAATAAPHSALFIEFMNNKRWRGACTMALRPTQPATVSPIPR